MRRPGLPPVVQSRIATDLQRLGLQTGDRVMLHASVSAIGWVVGGPDVVLSAILDVIGPEGTLMMLTGWEESTYHLDEWTEERKQAYMSECPAFDPGISRARQHSIGVLSEYLRTWPGSFRSAHPEASVAAVGEKAEWLTRDHPMDYSYGTGSPFEKLCQLEGRILVAGAPLGSLTVLHHAEFLARIPGKRVVRFKAPVLESGERVWVEIEDFDSSKGVVDWDGEDYFDIIGREAITAGLASVGTVGMAESYLFDAQRLVDFAVQWLERTFR